MKTKLEWLPFQGGFMGILPCGITVAVIRIVDGAFMGGYQARFGTCEIRKIFWDPEVAKDAAITLARSVLDSCQQILEEDSNADAATSGG